MSENPKKPPVPAWKLRQEMKAEQSSSAVKSKTALDVQAKLKKKMQQAALDPNLPAAFKVANVDRLAFSKQQERRKNNDDFMSMNSAHPASKPPAYSSSQNIVDDDSSVDISFASEDSFE